ncbi:CAP-Gly domain-containing linker protein 1 [Lamellibrachia satsuma]|nr:CAP-Gly domain-containing linker protein 1 [Lamellibrachia satsuma]
MAGDHLEETTTLQKMLDATMKTLDNSGEKVQKLSGEVTQLKAELTRMRTYEQSVVTLTDEKQSLEKRLQNLELIAMPANGNVTANSNMSTSENVVELQSENNNLTSQVDFLNSVIADLQRKNEAFQARLEVMESGGITNGNNSSDASDVPRKIPAPRLFCDICDVFDLHDTEDCPKQEMSDSPEMTHYHGDRTEQRPFCDICEVFGHWTAQCDDEQTF